MSNRFVGFIFFAMALWWYFGRTPEVVRAPTPRPIAQSKLEAPKPIATPQKVATRTPAPTQPPMMKVIQKPPLPPEPYAGPMELVHFKVEDGLAVAFGDTILGKPVSNEPITQGFNKPPKPEPWKSREIPYIIHPELKNPERVQAALNHIAGKTVVTFTPCNGEKDALVFQSGKSNCKSYLGKVGGHQPILLADNCGWVEIVHEVMHAMGFVHEHSRTDRDQFVEVVWNNVQDEFKPQFAMVTEDMMEPLRGFDFDYHSVMLYPPQLFSKRSGDITLKSRGEKAVDPSVGGLSQQDADRINKLFN